MNDLRLVVGVVSGAGGKTDSDGNQVFPNEDAVSVGGCLIATDSPQPVAITAYTNTPVLVLVADGMGGHRSPERASREVAQRLGSMPGKLVTPDGLLAELNDAHRALGQIMTDDPETRGMGTTVAGIVFQESSAAVFNVGDSRVYRFRNNRVVQLSIDDARSPLTDPSNVITQALGVSPDAEPDFDHHGRRIDDLQDGDEFLICSDGLTDHAPTIEIECILGLDRPILERAQTLYDLAIKTGTQDNVSVAVVKVFPRTNPAPVPIAVAEPRDIAPRRKLARRKDAQNKDTQSKDKPRRLRGKSKEEDPTS